MITAVETVAKVLLRQYGSEYDAGHLTSVDFADTARDVVDALTAEPDDDAEAALARLITSSVAGSRWRDLTPLDIARHLIANGVRIVVEVENR